MFCGFQNSISMILVNISGYVDGSRRVKQMVSAIESGTKH